MRWFVYWPLALLIVVGLIALAFIPQPWKQIVVTLVFIGELVIVSWLSRVAIAVADKRRHLAEAELGRAHRELDVYGDHYGAVVRELRRHDPAAAAESQLAVNRDLMRLEAIGSALHRKDRDDG